MSDKFSQITRDLFPTTSTLLSNPLTYTLNQLWETFGNALNLTLITIVEWIKVFLKLFAFLMHFILLIWPYIEKSSQTVYNQWSLLSTKTQIVILSIIAFVIFSFWLKRLFIKHKYIHRINKKYKYIKSQLYFKYQSIIYIIQSKSMKLAMLFPHLIFFSLFFIILYFVQIEYLGTIHDTLFIILAFLYPFVKTYYVLQENNSNMESHSTVLCKDDKTDKSKTIDNWKCIEYWSEFWICRSFILFCYFLICYLLSYVPSFMISFIDNINPMSVISNNDNDTINVNNDLLANAFSSADSVFTDATTNINNINNRISSNIDNTKRIEIITEFFIIWLILWLQFPITHGSTIIIRYISKNLFMLDSDISDEDLGFNNNGDQINFNFDDSESDILSNRFLFHNNNNSDDTESISEMNSVGPRSRSSTNSTDPSVSASLTPRKKKLKNGLNKLNSPTMPFKQRVVSSPRFEKIYKNESRKASVRGYMTNASNNSLSSKISLQTVNNGISFILTMLRPILPRYVYDIVTHSLYQILICLTFSLLSPKLGCLFLGYLLPIYTSIVNLYNWKDIHYDYQHIKLKLFDHRIDTHTASTTAATNTTAGATAAAAAATTTAAIKQANDRMNDNKNSNKQAATTTRTTTITTIKGKNISTSEPANMKSPFHRQRSQSVSDELFDSTTTASCTSQSGSEGHLHSDKSQTPVPPLSTPHGNHNDNDNENNAIVKNTKNTPIKSRSRSDGAAVQYEQSPMGSYSMFSMKNKKNNDKNDKLDRNNTRNKPNVNITNNNNATKGSKTEWKLGSLFSFVKDKFGLSKNESLSSLKENNPDKYEQILVCKEKELWNELDNSMKVLIDWLKYWIIFILFEIIWDFISVDIGLARYIPFWYQFKLIILFWLQLPSNVPFNANFCFEYVTMPLYILDFSHTIQTPKNIKANINNSLNNVESNNKMMSKKKNIEGKDSQAMPQPSPDKSKHE